MKKCFMKNLALVFNDRINAVKTINVFTVRNFKLFNLFRFFEILIFSFIAIGCLIDNTFAAEDKFLTVDKAFVPSIEQHEQDIKISFKIAPKYYLYEEIFEITAENSEITNIEIPHGTLHDDEYMGPSHIFTDTVQITAKVIKTSYFPKIKVKFQGCTEGLCYPPTIKTFNLKKLNNNNVSENLTNPSSDNLANNVVTKDLTNSSNQNTISYTDNQIDNNNFNVNASSNSIYKDLKDRNLFYSILIFFGFGILLSLTPCMFPMYPIWSSIILGGKQKTVKTTAIYSILYSQGIAITYMIVGFVIAYLGAQFHAFVQQPIVLSLISIIFLVLALSMFGCFNITIPSKIQNLLEQKSYNLKGGTYIGVFLMGALSAIIASPCTTAPLAGALLFIAQDGVIVKGGMFLYILAIGMSVPLFIIAFVGQKFLPKNGAWMETVKVLCGFIMLFVPVLLLEPYLPKLVTTLIYLILVTAILIYLAFAISRALKQRPYFSNKLKTIVVIHYLVLAVVTISAVTLGYQAFDDSEEQTLSYKEMFKTINNISELKQEITKSNLVLVDLRANWCRECIHYEKTTFSDKNVQDYLKQYSLVMSDVTDSDAPSQNILLEYNIKGVPAILVFKEQKLIHVITGYLNAEEFISELNNLTKN